MQKRLFGAMIVVLLGLTPAPTLAQPEMVIAQAADSVEVDALAARQEEQLSKDLARLRVQIAATKQEVARLTKNLDAMSATMDAMSLTMEKMKKSNRKI